MAKIGKDVQGRWKKTYPATSENKARRKEYALRKDGVLLKKATFLNDDGTVWFSDGWKRVGKRTLERVDQALDEGWERN